MVKRVNINKARELLNKEPNDAMFNVSWDDDGRLTMTLAPSRPVDYEGKAAPGVSLSQVKEPDRMMKNPLIVYHVNDPDLCLGGKTKVGHTNSQYLDCRWLWGNVITNKARGGRTDVKFASYVDPKGEKLHHFTHATFKQLFCGGLMKVKHVHLNPVVAEEFRMVLNHATQLNHGQVANLVKALQGNQHYREMKFGYQL